MRKVIVVTVAAAALVVIGALPAGAGEEGTAAPLHIRKVVVGPVPPGTQFVEMLACEAEEGGDPIIFTSGGQPPAASKQFVFDAQGNPVGTGDTATFVGPGTCTVTETQTGGANSVSYQCEGTIPPGDNNADGTSGGGRFGPRLAGVIGGPIDPCVSSGPQSDPIGVRIVASDQEATVTVTNTFEAKPPSPPPPPKPAQVVVVTPRFTG